MRPTCPRAGATGCWNRRTGTPSGASATRAELVDAAGLPQDQAATVLKTRSYAAPIDADWALARQKQVTAVPTFIMGINKLVGAQPYEALVQMVTAAGASPNIS